MDVLYKEECYRIMGACFEIGEKEQPVLSRFSFLSRFPPVSRLATSSISVLAGCLRSWHFVHTRQNCEVVPVSRTGGREQKA